MHSLCVDAEGGDREISAYAKECFTAVTAIILCIP